MEVSHSRLGCHFCFPSIIMCSHSTCSMLCCSLPMLPPRFSSALCFSLDVSLPHPHFYCNVFGVMPMLSIGVPVHSLFLCQVKTKLFFPLVCSENPNQEVGCLKALIHPIEVS